MGGRIQGAGPASAPWLRSILQSLSAIRKAPGKLQIEANASARRRSHNGRPCYRVGRKGGGCRPPTMVCGRSRGRSNSSTHAAHRTHTPGTNTLCSICGFCGRSAKAGATNVGLCNPTLLLLVPCAGLGAAGVKTTLIVRHLKAHGGPATADHWVGVDTQTPSNRRCGRSRSCRTPVLKCMKHKQLVTAVSACVGCARVCPLKTAGMVRSLGGGHSGDGHSYGSYQRSGRRSR